MRVRIMRVMRNIERIRRNVFDMPQGAFAKAAEVSQSTVSRWEAGDFDPNLVQLENIRSVARDAGVKWDDAWFFDAPDSPLPQTVSSMQKAAAANEVAA